MNSIGENLRRFRGNESQAGFARRLGIKNQQTYQRYEEGTRQPRASMLHQMANILGVSVGDLMGESSCNRDFPPVCNVNRKTSSAADAARYNFEFALRSATTHPEGDRAVHWLGTMLLMLASGIDNKGDANEEKIVTDIIAKLFNSARGEKV